MSDDKPTNDGQVELDEFDKSRRTDLTVEQSRKWDAIDATFEAFLEADLLGLNHGAYVTDKDYSSMFANVPNEPAFCDYLGRLSRLLPSTVLIRWSHVGNQRSITVNRDGVDYCISIDRVPDRKDENGNYDYDEMICSSDDLYPPARKVAQLISRLDRIVPSDPEAKVVYVSRSAYAVVGIKL